MALMSFWRFTLNTTIGFASMRDFAGTQGFTYQNQSFTNTLSGWLSPPHIAEQIEHVRRRQQARRTLRQTAQRAHLLFELRDRAGVRV